MAAEEQAQNRPPEERYPGGRPVGIVGIYLLLGYLLIIAVLTFISLVVLWPPIRPEGKSDAQKLLETAGKNAIAGVTPTPPPPTPVPTPDPRPEHQRIRDTVCLTEMGEAREGVTPLKIPFMERRCVYDEDRLFLIVLFAGALGGLVYALRSVTWYIGNRRLKQSWTPLYFLTPFSSAAIALVFYFVIRGGFFSPTSSVSDTSPFGFAALAALIGMFTEQAANKLRDVAATVLTPKEQGKDHAGAAPVITTLTPAVGPTAGGTSVVIAGDHFRPGASVTFGGVAATVESVDEKLIQVSTPPHAPGKVDVVVTNTDKQTQTASKAYEYRDDTPAPTATGVGVGAGGGVTPDGQTGGQQQPGQSQQQPGQSGEAQAAETAQAAGDAEGQTTEEVLVNDDAEVAAEEAATEAGGQKALIVAPPYGVPEGGEEVAITGAGFVDGAAVLFGETPAPSVTFMDSNTLTAVTPPGAVGKVALTVRNPDGTTFTLPEGESFEYTDEAG